jgi:hypothetical protein
MTKSDRKVVKQWGGGVSGVREGGTFFIEVEGVKIAKRGLPGTPQANTWISLEPGWEVTDDPDDSSSFAITNNSAKMN